MAGTSRPLDNFPLVRSRHVDEVREALARVYARPTLTIANGYKTIDAVMNDCRLQHVALAFGSYGTAVEVQYPATERFMMVLPSCGGAELVTRKTRVTLAPGGSATVSPDTGFNGRYGADYEFMMLKIDAQALTRKLLTLTGATINEPLRMHPRIVASRSETRILHEYLPMLAGTLSTADAPMPAWWIAQTEQLLMVMFLCSHQHNYSHLLEQQPRGSAPFQVRRVEEFIEANPECPVTLEDLAEVSGVSAFSLFRAFKRARGYSPFEFAARLRARRDKARR
ncbi:MAG TPA: AraC family transcriptional regulator [Pseudolabrys sp.]|nr:AraC family transcriptional regulator [Pseudolabrys sp.]